MTNGKLSVGGKKSRFWLGLLMVLSLSFLIPTVQAAPKKKVTTVKLNHAHLVAKRKVSPRIQRKPLHVVSLAKRTKRIAAVPQALPTPGVRISSDLLNLKSSVALVVDQETNEVLLRKNDLAVLPIASLTKLMTGLILNEAHLPMDEMITITEDDVDTEKGSSSRLGVGTELNRGELLQLALMSSENRAAHALARTYPGGLAQFVQLMNAKARTLGMNDTHYVEPTGLSSLNHSSAHDLVKLVGAAHQQPLLRELTTTPQHFVEVGHRVLQYNNTNRLVKNPSWDIGLQKTGYISEAGQCLVMQVKVAGRQLIMVFLDSVGKLSRLADAARVRQWLESAGTTNTDRHPSVG
jgi:serine-type D-Ala-D-Ala endopeptidase (penicillin-binding protein 7)